MSAIFFNRLIGPVPIDCMIRESPSHRLGISEIPIETGAKITDHAYIEPKRLRLEFGALAGAAAFAALVRFQESRVPFTVVSGLYVYTNMLIADLSADRDADWSRVLHSFVELQEAIIVETAYAASETGDASSTGQPGGKDSLSAATPSKGRAGDFFTADRVTGIVQRGDAAVSSVIASQAASIIRAAFA